MADDFACAGNMVCDLGTDCLCTDAMRPTCEFAGSARLRPADRAMTAVVILSASLGFLAGALFMGMLA